VTTNPNRQPEPEAINPGGALASDELLAASHRMAASRTNVARALGRSRARRRILPSIIVTSMALLGAGLANAFVSSTIVPTASSATSSVAATSQSTANALTLSQLSAVIAADQRTLAAIAATAAKTSAAAASIGSGASPSRLATSASGSSAGLVSVAAPVAAAPAPATHATTGASVVH
jgi:hypothetical protein